MTNLQIYALIALSLSAAALYWLGYRFGKTDGHTQGHAEGVEEGQRIERANEPKVFRMLESSLRLIRAENLQLDQQCKTLKACQITGDEDRHNLLAIADKLKLASETFRAFPTAQKEARETLKLRDNALAIAARLAPIAQERAA
ncbi:hypothetical protein [Pseudomonas sp. NA-150]|uniref:hypothetical protein n=1 Tax=Pseudomonas sp. NA-150 TaxID=3367525 RepID=UPI0037C5A23E